MGRKVHPYNFRSLITKQYLSNWYSKPTQYSTNIIEDYILRTKLEEFLGQYLLISRVEIFKNNSIINKNNDITTVIYCLSPNIKNLLEKNSPKISNLLIIYKFYKDHLQYNLSNKKRSFTLKNYNKFFNKIFLINISKEFLKFFQTVINKKLKLKFIFIKNLYNDMFLIVKEIGYQLNQDEQISCKRLLYSIIKKLSLGSLNILGIKIKVSGRHGGADIATTEKITEGRMPLNVIKEKIDYVEHSQNTLHGVFGIKIWILRDIE